jgi:hypothetical protein
MIGFFFDALFFPFYLVYYVIQLIIVFFFVAAFSCVLVFYLIFFFPFTKNAVSLYNYITLLVFNFYRFKWFVPRIFYRGEVSRYAHFVMFRFPEISSLAAKKILVYVVIDRPNVLGAIFLLFENNNFYFSFREYYPDGFVPESMLKLFYWIESKRDLREKQACKVIVCKKLPPESFFAAQEKEGVLYFTLDRKQNREYFLCHKNIRNPESF